MFSLLALKIMYVLWRSDRNASVRLCDVLVSSERRASVFVCSSIGYCMLCDKNKVNHPVGFKLS